MASTRYGKKDSLDLTFLCEHTQPEYLWSAVPSSTFKMGRRKPNQMIKKKWVSSNLPTTSPRCSDVCHCQNCFSFVAACVCVCVCVCMCMSVMSASQATSTPRACDGTAAATAASPKLSHAILLRCFSACLRATPCCIEVYPWCGCWHAC